MKKRIVIVMVILGAFFASCQKENLPIIKKGKVRIFLSAQGSNNQFKSEQKSSEVKSGDTVEFPRNINILMYAEDENGQAIRGNWDISLEQSDNPIGYSSPNQEENYSGDQISNDFKEYGIYKVSFGKFINYGSIDVLINFYVRINGVPGKVGDGYNNNYIFRMEKKELYNFSNGQSSLKKLFFIYFKYRKNILEKQAYMQLSLHHNGIGRMLSSVKLKKWEFSKENYYYCIIDPQQIRKELGKGVTMDGSYYQALFIITDNNGQGGLVDPNNYVSSWSNYSDGIDFSFQ